MRWVGGCDGGLWDRAGMVVVRQTHFTTGVVGGGGVGVEGEGLSKNTQYNQHNCEIRPRVLAHTKHTHTYTQIHC